MNVYLEEEKRKSVKIK